MIVVCAKALPTLRRGHPSHARLSAFKGGDAWGASGSRGVAESPVDVASGLEATSPAAGTSGSGAALTARAEGFAAKRPAATRSRPLLGSCAPAPALHPSTHRATIRQRPHIFPLTLCADPCRAYAYSARARRCARRQIYAAAVMEQRQAGVASCDGSIRR